MVLSAGPQLLLLEASVLEDIALEACWDRYHRVRDVLRVLPRGHREETTAEAFELLAKLELGK